MPDISKQLNAVLNGLEKIQAKLDALESAVDEIHGAIDVQWAEVSELLNDDNGAFAEDDETGETPRQQAAMGWPMTGEPVKDMVEPEKPFSEYVRMKLAEEELKAAKKAHEQRDK